MRIHSNILSLRKTEEKDLEFVLAAERSEDNRPFIGQWTADQHRAALHDAGMLHLIIETDTGEPAGYVIVTGLQNANLSVCIQRIVIERKGRGYGKEMLPLLISWLFRSTPVHRLWLDVREHNVRARHLYETVGFVYEGTLRDCVMTESGFESEHILSILRPEYEAGR
ncbi:GNAT family N-acetyltransferase [Paenibacillus sp. 7124]|uniref:GNAT family N-acetyltransferase n=1 Tax=Paenibacillus apii TaxID=1850370 RepID=A0A6M1PFM0_9BACL|nr:GNAT family protein [Paenibacillus apii]NGM82177.1 GNAT family N-acetyltransferase [Paenibacillus apii]